MSRRWFTSVVADADDTTGGDATAPSHHLGELAGSAAALLVGLAAVAAIGALVGPDLPLLPARATVGWAVVVGFLALTVIDGRLRTLRGLTERDDRGKSDPFSLVLAATALLLVQVAAYAEAWSSMIPGLVVVFLSGRALTLIRAARWRGVMVTAALTGLLLPAWWVTGTSERPGLFRPTLDATAGDWIEDLLRLVVTLALLGMALYFFERTETEAERHATEREAAVAEERRRIARELHDVVSHHVTVMTVQAQGAAAALHTGRDEQVGKALDSISESGRTALTDLRTMVAVLRADEPGSRAPAPDLSRLDELAESARSAGVEVTLDVEPGIEACAAAHLATYRVVQEALTNVRKHAGGAPTAVRVWTEDGRVETEVTSVSAVPLRPAARRGFGLTGLEERVTVLGGRFEAGPSAAGFTVRASLPCDASSMAT